MSDRINPADHDPVEDTSADWDGDAFGVREDHPANANWDDPVDGRDFVTSPSMHVDELRRRKVIDLSDTPFNGSDPAAFGGRAPSTDTQRWKKNRQRKVKASTPWGSQVYGKEYVPTYRPDAAGKKPKRRMGAHRASDWPRHKHGWGEHFKNDHRSAVREALDLGLELGGFSIVQRTGNEAGRPTKGQTAGVLDAYQFALYELEMTVEEALATNRPGRPANPGLREFVRDVLAAVAQDYNPRSLAKASGFSHQRVYEALKGYDAVAVAEALAAYDAYVDAWIESLQKPGHNPATSGEEASRVPSLKPGHNPATHEGSTSTAKAKADEQRATPAEVGRMNDDIDSISRMALRLEGMSLEIGAIAQSLQAKYPTDEKLSASVEALLKSLHLDGGDAQKGS